MSDLRAPQFPAQFDASLPSTDALQHAVQTDAVQQAEVSGQKTVRKARPAPKVDLANLPDLLTISEVSALLRVSPLTIKRWGKRGKLPAIRINSRGDRRYKKQAVLWMLGMTENE